MLQLFCHGHGWPGVLAAVGLVFFSDAGITAEQVIKQ